MFFLSIFFQFFCKFFSVLAFGTIEVLVHILYSLQFSKTTRNIFFSFTKRSKLGEIVTCFVQFRVLRNFLKISNCQPYAQYYSALSQTLQYLSQRRVKDKFFITWVSFSRIIWKQKKWQHSVFRHFLSTYCIYLLYVKMKTYLQNHFSR